jgi:hypothetical protein
MGRRVHIDSDDVTQLVDEQRIVGQIELPPAVGLKAVRLPDAAYHAGADAGGFRHHVDGPVRTFAKRILQRQRHQALGRFRTERRNARWPRLFAQQSFEACRGEALLPGKSKTCVWRKRLVDLPMAWPDQWRTLGLQAPALA